MTTKQYLIFSSIAFLVGAFIFALQKEYIIFNFGRTAPHLISSSAQKQGISFWYWHQNAWHCENVPLIVSDDTANTLQQLLNRWIQLLLEEKIITKKITIDAVLLHYNKQELFISFDRVPWSREDSTFEKWMMIEGILKTIKNVIPTIKKVHFLINHQPIDDTHLDFTNAWPIDGFIAN